MKAKLPMMLDDPQTSQHAGLDDFEMFESRDEDFFLDGPVSRRVAVLDFDAATGAVLPGARFVDPGKRKFGSYDCPAEEGIYGRSFQQVSAFATVLRTMYLYEEPDTLGRQLTWAFGAPQLLVVPRAGEDPNAFYERESHSLQLFYISRGEKPPACACLSRDIIAHETAHAILDGIAPDLYNSLTPQSLALHEAIADLTALLMSFRSGKLREAVLKETKGSIADSSAFSTVAPEFGQARDPTMRYLRSLLNNKTLDREDKSLDENGVPNRVNRYESHSLSEALSGALYTVMVKIHGSLATDFSASGKALFVGGERFKRMILRALDYLPPGEVSFGDYGRAILAADQAAHPKDSQERQWICEEFVRRALVPDKAALKVETNVRYKPLAKVDLPTLAGSDWVAYQFADKNREFLGIPAGVPFRVRPRLDTTKLYYLAKGAKPEPIRELIFKVSWDQEEPNSAGSPFAGKRQITVGTTLGIDWETRTVRARLTSQWQGEQKSDRDEMLKKLAGALNDERSGLHVESSNGLMRVRATARMLHVAGAVSSSEPGGAAPKPAKASARPIPPPGVDAGAFYDLCEYRSRT
ncbi:MAG TPA: hypothetical protein VF179_24205 [Thermoanaerobaculia bacterium]|nr:hypothetical protein [Thermoanaerobaculia bacterium]